MRKTAIALAVTGALAMAANVQAGDFNALSDGNSIPASGVVSVTGSSSKTGYVAKDSSVFGGVKLAADVAENDAGIDALATIKSTTVTVENGEWDKIIGGSSLKATPNASEGKFLTPALTSSIVIVGKDVTSVSQLAGGSQESGSGYTDKNRWGGQFVAFGQGGQGTTQVTIDGGAFGSTKNTDSLIISQYVVAGDAIKLTAAGVGSTDQNVSHVTSNLKSTLMTINAGTFDAPVVGGSMAMIYRADSKGDQVEATVGESTLNIEGGTFNHAVTAAGYAWAPASKTVGEKIYSGTATSNVSKATLIVKAGTFNAGIYAGGISNNYGTSTVGESNITIDHVKDVGNIYGTVGLLTIGSKNESSGSYDFTYEQKKSESGSYDFVKTNLTLNNSSAGTVLLGGSNAFASVLKVEGESSIGKLMLDDSDKVEIAGENGSKLTLGDGGLTGIAKFTGTLTLAGSVNGTANIYGTVTTDPTGTGTFNVVTGGTLVAEKLSGLTDNGKVTLTGGTLQTSSSVVFATKNLIAEKTAEISKDESTSVNKELTAESGTVALTDAGFYTAKSLKAMSEAANGTFNIKILNAKKAADDTTPAEMLNNIVQSTETVIATVEDNKLEVAQGESGGATIKLNTDVKTVALEAKTDVKDGTVVGTGTTSGGALFTNKSNEAVTNVTVGNGVTLQLGEVKTVAETQGSLDSLVVDGGEDGTAKLVVANMAAQVSNVTLKKGAKVSIGTTGENGKRGELAVKNLKMEADSEIFLDPIWTGNDSLVNASFLSASSVESLNGKLVIGQNSAAALGASKAEAVAAFDKLAQQNANFRWGENDITAALYLGQAIDITGSNAEITVNGDLTASNYTTGSGNSGGEASKVTIASKGLLAINQQAIGTGSAITGSLTLKDGSVIGIVNATGDDLTLATVDVVASDNQVRVVTDNPFVTGKLVSAEKKIKSSVDANGGLGAIASTGLQAMTRRADSVLAQTIADRTSVDQDYATGTALWVDVTGERYQADKMDNNASFKSDMGYGAFGGDFAITEDISAGAAIQYGKGTVRSSVSNIKNSIDSYGITAYGSMKFGDAKVVAEASYIKNENDITSSQTALNQSVDTEVYSFGVRGQHRFTAGQFQFVPSVGVRVSRLNTDAMKVGAVNIKKQEQTLVQVPIALRINGFEQNAGGWSVAPSFKIAYVPTFGDKEISVLGADQTVIDTSPVQGDFGIRAQKGNLMINANFMAGGGKDGTSSVGGKAGLKYVF